MKADSHGWAEGVAHCEDVAKLYPFSTGPQLLVATRVYIYSPFFERSPSVRNPEQFAQQFLGTRSIPSGAESVVGED